MILRENKSSGLCNKQDMLSTMYFPLLALAALQLYASPLDRYEFMRKSLFVPSKLGELQLFHENNQFTIMKDGAAHTVQNCFVDKEIRNISTEKLVRFLGLAKDLELNGKQYLLLKASKCEGDQAQVDCVLTEHQKKIIATLLSASDYLSVDRLSDGEYCIHARHRLSGGGPIGATIGVFAGKFAVYLVYGASVVAVGGAVSLVAGAYAKTALPVAEMLSTKAAIAGGIDGGVATGPA